MQYNINLVFYGEDGEVEYGGAMEHADRASLPYDIFDRFSNQFPESFLQYGLTKQELDKYGLSKDELELMKAGAYNSIFSVITICGCPKIITITRWKI